MMDTAKSRDILSLKFIFSDGVTEVSFFPRKNKTFRIFSNQFLDDSASNESRVIYILIPPTSISGIVGQHIAVGVQYI